MIKRLTVKKLYGRTNFDLCFHADMNVLTGRNGCGKTTLLKLAWYMVSGNFDRVVAEMDFESAKLETDTFTLSVTPNKSGVLTSGAEWKLDGVNESASWSSGRQIGSSSIRLPTLLTPPQREIEGLKLKVIEASQGSVFFPTFRRIEGGFSTSKVVRQEEDYFYGSSTNKIEEAMSELSERLSNGKHRLVASISTKDIVDMVSRQYTRISTLTNRDNTQLSKNVTEMIERYDPAERPESDTVKLAHLETTLSRIKKIVTENSTKQERRLQPFHALGQLITQVLKHNGIRINPGITLGDANDSISSDALSAGEKQMLSFVAYNAFTKDSVIFIDEPEISLHVDWQRTLFSILEAQGTNNQFIIATHSPFIYSKYTDKEIVLNSDRGE